MKQQLLKYASLMLATAMVFAVADSANASNKKKSGHDGRNDCRDSREKDRDCDRDREHDRDCEDDDSGSGGVVAAGIAISPSGTIVTTDFVIAITAPFTAPANSDAVVLLLQDGATVGSFVVPAGTTTGTAAFTAALNIASTTVFQTQLSFTSTTGGGDDDDDDCDGRRGGRDEGKRKGKNRAGCHEDDDNGGSGTTTTTLLSDTLVVIQDGGISND
jgi:hypothetical protein